MGKGKKNRRNGWKLFENTLRLISLPAIFTVLVFMWNEQKNINENNLNAKDSQNEVLLRTVEMLNLQIDHLTELQSDILLDRLKTAKKDYEEDLKSLGEELRRKNEIIDSAGIPITSINTLEKFDVFKKSYLFSDSQKNQVYAMKIASIKVNNDFNNIVKFAGQDWEVFKISDIRNSSEFVSFYSNGTSLLQDSNYIVAPVLVDASKLNKTKYAELQNRNDLNEWGLTAYRRDSLWFKSREMKVKDSKINIYDWIRLEDTANIKKSKRQ